MLRNYTPQVGSPQRLQEAKGQQVQKNQILPRPANSSA